MIQNGRKLNSQKKITYEFGNNKIIPGNRWQDEVEGGWKKLLRTARNRRILHMAME
jgi:hypothetical protein